MTAVLLLPGCAGSRHLAEPAPVSEGPRYYFCWYAPSAVEIDGRMVEAAWSAAHWTELFVDIEGDAKPAPRHHTRVKMLWDSEFLYIGAMMQEPHLRASLTERDSIVYHDNDFEVFIDPDGDTLDYFEIEINAYNTIFDLFLPKPYDRGGLAQIEWDVDGLRTAVHTRGTMNDPSDMDLDWSVELAIPWRALAGHALVPVPPEPQDVWRINFSRVQWRHRIVDGRYETVPDVPEDNWVWSPQGVINMHRPEMWGYVEFARKW